MNVSKEEFRNRLIWEKENRARERKALKRDLDREARETNRELYMRRRNAFVKLHWRLSVM